MAILVQSAKKDSHWYTSEGLPMHEVPRAGKPGADGDLNRPTTLADARKLGLYPSVTGILGVLGKPQLEKWKMNQVALATLRVPQQEQESPEYWCKRVIEASNEQVNDAADLGSLIHKNLDHAVHDMSLTKVDIVARPYVAPVLEWFKARNLLIDHREKIVVNSIDGFAGTFDMAGRFLLNGEEHWFLLDYKSRKTKPGVKVEPYDFQPWQVAAYARTLNPEVFTAGRFHGINLYVSTTEIGRIEHVSYKPNDMIEYYNLFRHTTAIWRHLNGYDPRKAIAVPELPFKGAEPSGVSAILGTPISVKAPELPAVGKKDYCPVKTNGKGWMKTMATYADFLGVRVAIHRPIKSGKLVKSGWRMTCPQTGMTFESLIAIKGGNVKQFLSLAEAYMTEVAGCKDFPAAYAIQIAEKPLAPALGTIEGIIL